MISKKAVIIITLSTFIIVAANAQITGGKATPDQSSILLFTGGTPAYADDVNDNIAVLRDGINANETRISSIETTDADITAVAAGSGLAGGGTSGSVTLSVGTGAITATHLATNSVAAAEIAAGAVGTSEIADGSVSGTDIANSTITGTDIAADTITAGDIAADAIGTSELANNAVYSANIADGQVGSADITNGTIVNTDVSASAAIAASKIASMPGLDYAVLSAVSGLSTAVNNLGNVAINIPGPGYVLATLHGYAVFFGDNTTMSASVSLSSSAHGSNGGAVLGRLDGSGTARYEHSFITSQVFYFSSGGTKNIYGIANKSSVFGTNTINLGNLYLTAVYVPFRY